MQVVTKAAPGLLEAVYLLAKVQYLSGNTEAARSGAQYCIKQDSTSSNAHLLMAQINMSEGSVQAASESLEVGLSYNFEVHVHLVSWLCSLSARFAILPSITLSMPKSCKQMAKSQRVSRR